MPALKNFTVLVSYVKVALLIDGVLGVLLDFSDGRILLVLYYVFNLTQAANADLPCVMSLVESDNRESYYDL